MISSAAWNQWRARQERKRTLIGWGSATAGWLLVFALLLWGGFLPPLNVGEKGVALSVKLGNPEGEDLPLQVRSLPDPAMQAVLSAQRTAVTRTEETRSDPGPQAVPLPKKTQPPATPSTPVPAPAAVTKPDQPAVTEKVIRGVEKGNSSELILKPQGDKISQNAYWPVYLFMPLPSRVDAALLGKIRDTKLYTADERKALLLQFYNRAGDSLVLKDDVPLPVRPAVWEILETAGYDVSNADYKKGKDLKPVVITFSLGTPASPSDNPAITGIHLDQSSGSDAVDKAVLYAFGKSTFANGTGKVAQGKYTYDFTAKK